MSLSFLFTGVVFCLICTAGCEPPQTADSVSPTTLCTGAQSAKGSIQPMTAPCLVPIMWGEAFTWQIEASSSPDLLYSNTEGIG